MPYEPPLTDFLSLSPVGNVTKQRRLWGGAYIHLYNYYQVLSFLYEAGAILGRARRNKLNIFEKMLGTYVPSIKLSQKAAKKRLDRFRMMAGNEPDTFMRFIFLRELESTTRLSLADAQEAFDRGNKKALKPFQKKVPLEDAEGRHIEKTRAEIRMFVVEGIGFGSLFPELTEKMNRSFYKDVHIDWDTWSEAEKAIYASPEKPTLLSLEGQEETLLQVVGIYATECYPELLKPLALSRYKDEDFMAHSRYRGWWHIYHSLY